MGFCVPRSELPTQPPAHLRAPQASPERSRPAVDSHPPLRLRPMVLGFCLVQQPTHIAQSRADGPAGRGPPTPPQSHLSQSQRQPGCVLTPLGSVVLHGCCLDSHLGQGRRRGGQDLRGGAQLARARTLSVSLPRGTADPACVPPCSQSWAEPRSSWDCPVTKSWDGSHRLGASLRQPRQPPGAVPQSLDEASQPVSGETASPGPQQVPSLCSATSLPWPRLVQLEGQ